MIATDRQRLSELFHVLSNSRRRYVLHYLANNSFVTDIRSLAIQVAKWEVGESDTTDERIESVRTSLIHSHLPKLADYGIITFDTDSSLVELTEKPKFDSLLDASKQIDVPE